MTTSLSAPPLDPAIQPSRRPSSVETSSTGWQKEKRSPLRLYLVLASVLVVAAVGWKAISGARLSETSNVAMTAAVETRSFNVVLKEKGELKAAKSTDVKCEVEGRSTIISLIPEGTAVKEGDLLVVLASDQIENRIREEELKEANAITAFQAAKAELDIQRDKNASDIRKAELQIELRRLELDKYQKGEWEQKLKDAQVAIDQAKISLERREQDYLASKELFAKNYTTQTEYEEAEFNFKRAGWELDKANMALDVLKTYTHVADLKQRQSDLEEAIKEAERSGKNADAEETKKLRDVEGKEKELDLIQDQLAKFRAQKEKCRIYAPTQGFVVYYNGGGGRWMMSNDQQIKEGAEVIERQVLMQLPDTSSMMVVVRIHEAKTDKLSLNQPVTVTVEGIPGRVFTGHVRKIAALADSQSSWLNPDLKEYETEILLDPTDAPLKPGVTAHTEILVQNVEEKLAIPVQAIYAKGGQRYVFRQKGDRAEPVPVEVGAIGAEWAEVASGIAGGDRLLLAFGDEYRRMIPDSGQDEGSGAPGMHRRSGPRGPRGGGSARQSSASPVATPASSSEFKATEEKTSDSQAGEKTAEQPASSSTETSTATPGGAVIKPLQTAPAKGYSVGKAP